ncbi:MAG: GerW family sporulation protein [Desulfitobacteriaceae bacterium]|nr:GerW family sporulation protein [Desulfitobacteriaceae bacterium]MDI6878842.1 GerW family sporulation protein [Desulfitobacteriaceae bacterium]MDI6914605.1 GerW family sporulation protein [Desulfitobacteriaceae bacterium]
MGNHPIEALMKTAMESIQQIVDVNTIVGDPVETTDGSVIIPVSRVACGFAAGGSEFLPPEDSKEDGQGEDKGGKTLPFGGGSGAGVSVQPVGFLVVGNGQIRLLPVDSNAVIERVIDTVPDLIDKISGMFKKKSGQDDVMIMDE